MHNKVHNNAGVMAHLEVRFGRGELGGERKAGRKPASQPGTVSPEAIIIGGERISILIFGKLLATSSSSSSCCTEEA